MLRVRTFIELESDRECVSVWRAVEPDNASAPRGVEIRGRCSSNVLEIEIVCRDVDVLTCRNTIDDLLSHVSIASKTIETLERDLRSGSRPH